MQAVQTVNEARYTYWHSIVDIATRSGLSREEFCRKYKISLKTFIHYEGIFQRQKERGYVYHRCDSAGLASESEDKVDDAAENAEDDKPLRGGKTEGTTCERSRYVEIPMTEGNTDASDDTQNSSKADTEVSIENSSSDQGDGDQVEADNKERESIVVDMGGCRISIGNRVKESTILAVLKAVSENA